VLVGASEEEATDFAILKLVRILHVSPGPSSVRIRSAEYSATYSSKQMNGNVLVALVQSFARHTQGSLGAGLAELAEGRPADGVDEAMSWRIALDRKGCFCNVGRE
jgi:hypothetical protein